MIEQFQILSDGEYGQLKDAIALITVLIAGSDGNFDKKEIDWATKVTNIRSYKMKDEVRSFYQDVGKDFEEKLHYYIDAFPTNVEDRTHIISERLEMLNPILNKLEHNVAAKLYKSYVSFAKHVANASGGFLGFFTVDAVEAKLMKLPMLTPIVYISTEEEE